MRSSSARTSSARRTSSAPSASSTCATVRGPMIGAVTTGLCRSHASATSAGAEPISAHSFSHASSLVRCDSIWAWMCCAAPPSAAGAVGEHAAEEAAAERAPRDHAESVVLARGEHLELHGPGVQVVEALLRHEAERVPAARRLVRLDDVPSREVAAPDVEHLPLRDQHVHRLPDLVPWCVAIDVVHLVQVDVVGLQPAEAVLTRLPDVQRGELALVRPRTARVVHLRRDDDAFAPAITLREPPADDRLGEAVPVAVDVGGVEEVQPELEAAVHDPERLVLVGLHTLVRGAHPEVHRAEHERAHAQSRASEQSIVHRSTLPASRISAAAEGADGPPARPS